MMTAAVVAASSCGCSSEESGASSASSGDASLEASDDVMTSDAGAPDTRDDDAAAADVVTSTDVSLDPFDDTTNYNDCTPYDFSSNDHTAPSDPRVVTFPFDPAPAQYQPRCILIRATQTITYKGNFQYHPLGPAGGDVPTPITIDPTPAGLERAITFPNPGFFGFECVTHEAPLMYGAVFVIP